MMPWGVDSYTTYKIMLEERERGYARAALRKRAREARRERKGERPNPITRASRAIVALFHREKISPADQLPVAISSNAPARPAADARHLYIATYQRRTPMPLYIDKHRHIEGLTAEAVAGAHGRDV